MTRRRSTGRWHAAGERLARLAPKSFTERNPKTIGAIAIALVLAFVGAALVLTGSIFTSTYEVDARFPNAVGLGPGARVLLAGVPVGTVGSVAVQGNAVLLRLDIDDGVAVPGGTAAKIEVETLLGVTGVQLLPGQDWSHLLHQGSLITNTSAPVEFFEVRSSATDLLSGTDAQALGNLVQTLAEVTTGDSTQVHQIVQGLDQFTGTVAARKAQLSQLIDAAKQLTGALVARDAQLASVVDDLDSVVSALAAHSTQLGDLIDSTELAAAQTASLVGRNQPRLQQALDAVHSDLEVIGQHQLDLAQAVAYAGAAVQGFQSVGYSGPTDTPNSWANVFVNLVGASGAESVLGSCGALDEALDVALGPDPLPCAARTGPVPTVATGSTGSSTNSSTSGGG
jgi:phospholipid/cholesterol/gamma-HCH transport system substrate-binding protein